MGDVMSNVVGFLKEYIWKNGFEMLSRNPFAVYKAMVKHDIDTKTARLVMVTLMSGSHELVQEGRSVDEITDHIQAEHCLNKKTAGNLATVYLELFSDENRESWSKAAEAGFDEFCEGEWSVEWDGRCDWNTKHGGSYPCTAEASLTFSVTDKEKLHDHLSEKLKTNPFLSADDIYGILMKQIEDDLDYDMNEFCNADDYYEPFFEEFVGEGTYESEEKWKSWGLELIEFHGSGDIDFEP